MIKFYIYFYYNVGKILGHGQFGTVRLATQRIADNKDKKFAIKTIPKEKVQDKIEYIKRELEILKLLDHPNIIKFYEIFQDDMFIHYVMEYCEGGDLLSWVLKRQTIVEKNVARIMYKLISAVQHMHQQGIIHRDLKLDNILFQHKPDEPCSEVKIVDFGLSTHYQIPQNKKRAMKHKQSYVGTPLYCSPEIVKNVQYDFQTDMWSLGVILFVLLSGSQPFYQENQTLVYQKIVDSSYSIEDPEWDHISNEAKELVVNLLQKEPKLRYTANQAVEHEWLKKYYLEPSKDLIEKSMNYVRPTLNNLMKFNCQNLLQKEALKVLVNHQLTNKELEDLRQSFKAIDTDRNGEIGFHDLLHAIQKVGANIDENQLLSLFKNIHQNETSEIQNLTIDKANLKINYSQFMAAAVDMRNYFSVEKLWKLFRYFDPDNEGVITIDNFQQLVAREGRTLTSEEEKELVANVGDYLNFKEFCKHINPEMDLDKQIDDFQKNDKKFSKFITRQKTIQNVNDEMQKSKDSSQKNIEISKGFSKKSDFYKKYDEQEEGSDEIPEEKA